MRPSSQVFESTEVELVPVRNSRFSGSKFRRFALQFLRCDLMCRQCPWNTKHKKIASRNSFQRNSTGPAYQSSCHCQFQRSLDSTLAHKVFVQKVSKVAHSLQRLPRIPCAADLISRSSSPSQLHSSQHHLRNAKFAVVGCNVGLPISVQLDGVMTYAPVSPSQSCMTQTQSTL